MQGYVSLATRAPPPLSSRQIGALSGLLSRCPILRWRGVSARLVSCGVEVGELDVVDFVRIDVELGSVVLVKSFDKRLRRECAPA